MEIVFTISSLFPAKMMATNCEKYNVFFLCIVLAFSSATTNDTSSGNCGKKATCKVYMDFAAEAIDKAKNSSVTCSNSEGECGQKETLMSCLHVADEMINKAKINLPSCDSCDTPQETISDCSDLLQMGHRESGVYTISPKIKLSGNESFDVYCDMETDGGGWTVVQRRGDYKNPPDYFFKNWKSYKKGFGDLKKEFWLGNDYIFTLTNQEVYSARFDLVDIKNNTRYANYDALWIDGENSKYTLHISNYSGDAGDSMQNSDNHKFSAKDEDNDVDQERNCSHLYQGGWWFKDCHKAELDGDKKGSKGIFWIHWKGLVESLARTEIKIRPKNFRSKYVEPDATNK